MLLCKAVMAMVRASTLNGQRELTAVVAVTQDVGQFSIKINWREAHTNLMQHVERCFENLPGCDPKDVVPSGGQKCVSRGIFLSPGLVVLAAVDLDSQSAAVLGLQSKEIGRAHV